MNTDQTCFAKGTEFGFNGLLKDERFDAVARSAVGLELNPVWNVGSDGSTEIEICATDEAEGWSVYLRLASGEARILHDAPDLREAGRALVAAGAAANLPVDLRAWDFRCAGETVRALPEALRLQLSRAVAFPDREAHAVFALAARIELALHAAAAGSACAADR